MWLGKEFLDLKPKASFVKGKIDKLDILRIKNFCSAKYDVKRMKDKLPSGKKYFQTMYLTKDQINNPKLNRKANNPIRNQAKVTNRYFTEKYMSMENKHMKRCLTLLAIRKMQIKITRQHYTPSRMARVKNANTKCWLGCGQTESFDIAGRNVKWSAPLKTI